MHSPSTRGSNASRDNTALPARVTGTAALELEHALGFTQALQGLSFYPDPDASIVMYGCGKLIIVSDLHDSHNQKLLRAHDAAVTSVDFSPNGTLFASGQAQSIDSFCYFNIWDYATCEVKHRIMTPHKGQIDVVKFSPDDGMVATTGAEGMLCIWDTITGKKVASFQDTISGDQCKSLCWGQVQFAGTRNQKYTLYVAFNTGVRRCELTFSVKKLNFELVSTPCAMPGAGGRMGGFQRKFLSCAVLGDDLLCGTSSGDVLVFNAASGTYRTALTLTANGVTALLAAPEYNCVIVTGGDGSIKKITGRDTEWTLVSQTAVHGAVSAACISCDTHQVVAMTSAGFVYRVLTRDLAHTIAAESPLGGLTDVAVSAQHPDYFASTSRDGVVRVWDLSNYSIISTFSLEAQSVPKGAAPPQAAMPTSCAFDVQGSVVLSGWSDGRVRGIDFSQREGKLAWTMANGHKGAVHTVRVCDKYVLTGGEDSVSRIWARGAHELVAQMQEHKMPTTSVAIDNTTTGIVHSISNDMCLFSYDLTKVDTHPNMKCPKRVATHSDASSGGFLCMTQRVDREHEVIIGTVEGRILFFDLDYADPVLVLVDQQRVRVTSVEVSPDGRFLAAGLGDGSLTLYALDPEHSQKASLLLHAVCHSSAVVRCVWTGDGKQIVSAGGDGELIIWNFYFAEAGEIA